MEKIVEQTMNANDDQDVKKISQSYIILGEIQFS